MCVTNEFTVFPIEVKIRMGNHSGRAVITVKIAARL
jgi:hypothetical protein